MIFVFGSNLSGIHGAGAAKFAHQRHGALMGIGEGHRGNSYALPTKGKNITHMPLRHVVEHVEKFINYAKSRPDLTFQVTALGCGLAGFDHGSIAPLFKNAPENCLFDRVWLPILGDTKEYWGTF